MEAVTALALRHMLFGCRLDRSSDECSLRQVREHCGSSARSMLTMSVFVHATWRGASGTIIEVVCK